MKFEELSVEDQKLLNTEFDADLEKEAAAEVAMTQELYDTGFSKLAAATADELDKVAEEGEEGKDEKEEDEDEAEEKEDEGEKKEASARAAFTARGYIDGLMKEGSERHGDELFYLMPAIYEKLAAKGGKGLAASATAAWKKTKAMARMAKNKGGKALDTAKEKGQQAYKATKKYHVGAAHQIQGKNLKGEKTKGMAKAKNIATGAAKFAPHAGVAGLGAYGLFGGKKKEQA